MKKDKTIAVKKRRSWKAAQQKLLTASWQSYSRPIDADLRYGLSTLKARAKEQAQNNDHVRHFISLLHSNVVGPHGIKLQSRARLLNGKPDKRAAAVIEDTWLDWGKRGTCDVSGQYSWRDVCKLVLSCLAREGEALIRKWPGANKGFALQVLDPESLAIDINERVSGGTIRMGVEMDGWRRPVAYWIRPEAENAYQAYRVDDPIRVPAEEMIHLYLPEWTWQTRGIPWIATALTRLHHLGEYEEAELIAARIAAEKPGHYSQEMDAIGSPGTDTDAEDQFIADVQKGDYGVLPPGWSFQMDDPTHPTTAFPDFVKSSLRSISAGLGVSYNTLAQDLEGVNYTSLRMGAINERAVWMMLQEWFIESFIEPVFYPWLDSYLQMGELQWPNGEPLPNQRIKEYSRATWQARRWPWVDPLKEIQAAREAIALRTRSISDVIRESGREPSEVWEELASDMEMLETLGLTMAAPAEPEEPEKPEEKEEDDEETGSGGNGGRSFQPQQISITPEITMPTINIRQGDPAVHITNQVAVPDVSVVNEIPLDERETVVNVAAPVVNLPEQPAPIVNVNVPEQAAPVVNVEMPEQPAPIVNVEGATVNVPPQNVDVTVEVPARDKEISISRGKDGRIIGATVEEEDT